MSFLEKVTKILEPIFRGDMGAVSAGADTMTSGAGQFTTQGQQVHTTWQAIGAYYVAPESGQLLAATAPVVAATAQLSTLATNAATALKKFAEQVLQLRVKGEELKQRAAELDRMIAASVSSMLSDNPVLSNVNLVFGGALTAQGDALNAAGDALVKAALDLLELYETEERNCVNGINPEANLKQDNGDGDQEPNEYGYSADAMYEAYLSPGGSPWGTARGNPSLVGGIADGVIKMGEGIWALFTDEQARAQTLRMLGGVVHTFSPLAHVVNGVMGANSPLMSTEDAVKETAGFLKGLVASDEWQRNPGNALGQTVFNIGSMFVPGPKVIKPVGGALMKAANIGLHGLGELRLKVADLAARAGNAILDTKVSVPKYLSLPRLALPDGGSIRVPHLDMTTPKRIGDLFPSTRDKTPGGTAPRFDEDAPSASPRKNLDDGPRRPAELDPVPAPRRPDVGDGPAPHRPGDSGGAPPPRQPGAPDGAPIPRTSAEIAADRVHRANTDQAWFEKHYNADGHRKKASLTIDGEPLPKLRLDHDYDPLNPTPEHPAKWFNPEDGPPPLPAKYKQGAEFNLSRSPDTVPPANRAKIDEVVAARERALEADRAAEAKLSKAVDDLEAAKKASDAAKGELDARGSPEARAAYDEALRRQNDAAAAHAAAKEAHRGPHADMTNASEAFGDTVAARVAIPENFNVVERLDDGARGSGRFDQIYKTADGRIVVVEAKSVFAKLGERLHGKRRVQQGTPEYFDEILKAMRNRGESDLVVQLEDALDQGKIDYVVVRAKANNGVYSGYDMAHFDIGGQPVG